MTPDQFRRLALSFPDTSEHSHMGHPDFRAGGKIFATLGYPEALGHDKARSRPTAEIRWSRPGDFRTRERRMGAPGLYQCSLEMRE